jgi:hypothetical protein
MKRYESQDGFKSCVSLAHPSPPSCRQCALFGFAVKPLKYRRIAAFLAMPQALKPVFTLRV